MKRMMESVGGEGHCVEVPDEVRGRVGGFYAGVLLLGRYLFFGEVTKGNFRQLTIILNWCCCTEDQCFA